MQLPMA
ncbi:unnamed protein product [Linum tenue]|nr:unnamed protein product [Linum tenue]